jgi:hypothetical protein
VRCPVSGQRSLIACQVPLAMFYLRPLNPITVGRTGTSGFVIDSHPGDAVLIAPVSTQIPCQQGILQGILQFRGFLDRFRSKKLLRHSQLRSIPYAN